MVARKSACRPGRGRRSRRSPGRFSTTPGVPHGGAGAAAAGVELGVAVMCRLRRSGRARRARGSSGRCRAGRSRAGPSRARRCRARWSRAAAAAGRSRTSTDCDAGDRVHRGEHRGEVDRLAEGEAVGVEEADAVPSAAAGVGQHRRGPRRRRRSGSSRAPRRRAGRSRAGRTAGRRPRGRSRPSGSARASAAPAVSNGASTGAPPNRSAVTKTVCQEPVQRKVAAARCTGAVPLRHLGVVGLGHRALLDRERGRRVAAYLLAGLRLDAAGRGQRVPDRR